MFIGVKFDGYSIECKDEELVFIIMDIASSKKSEEHLLNWVINHLK